MQKRYGQKKFYKKLLKLDPKVKSKFDPNDTQRSIRAFEIKTHTKFLCMTGSIKLNLFLTKVCF